MIATLQSSVKKMNDLLARLSAAMQREPNPSSPRSRRSSPRLPGAKQAAPPDRTVSGDADRP
jgi:hypothetical protein